MAFRRADLAPEPYRHLGLFGDFLDASYLLSEPDEEIISDAGDVEWTHLHAMAGYCQNFLTNPNAVIGRFGPVCPFTARAIARRSLFITACTLRNADQDALTRGLSTLRDAFLFNDDRLPAEDRLFHSVVVTFPWVPPPEAPAFIEHAQQRLKVDYVASGLMIGEFYPDCQAPGLHSADFRPLQSPVPAIAIRHMTLQDAPFMLGDTRFRRSYEERFGDAGARRVAELLDSGLGGPVAYIDKTVDHAV